MQPVNQLFDNIKNKVLPQAKQQTLTLCSDSIQDGAKDVVHVISGELRDSIQEVERTNDYVVVAATAEHAAAEEFGTAYRPPHPYLLPQADRMQTEAPRILQNQIAHLL